MADPIWIIDGDNVTHARGGGGEYALLRERLSADVIDWAARVGVRAVVVLDGEGSDRTVGETLVCHSRKETADSVIERLAYRNAAGGEVTVVSNDTVVRHVSHRGGVHAMSAREFLDRLAAAPQTPRSGLNSRQRYQLSDAVDPVTRAALERIRRGQEP
jgi:predicted RNA-binding protein with PIN domain